MPCTPLSDSSCRQPCCIITLHDNNIVISDICQAIGESGLLVRKTFGSLIIVFGRCRCNSLYGPAEKVAKGKLLCGEEIDEVHTV